MSQPGPPSLQGLLADVQSDTKTGRSPEVEGGGWEHPSVIFSGYFSTWLSGALLEQGCSKLGLALFCKVLAQTQDEISTEIISEH